jgi:hypothetical protein
MNRNGLFGNAILNESIGTDGMQPSVFFNQIRIPHVILAPFWVTPPIVVTVGLYDDWEGRILFDGSLRGTKRVQNLKKTGTMGHRD